MGYGFRLGKTTMDWYLQALKKYAEFNGRARRTEYWMFALFNVIISLVLGLIEGIAGGPGVLASLYSLAVFVPSIAVSVRRLHDIDRSGWWLLIGFVPLFGVIALLVFMVLDSQPGNNQYGANPKEMAA
jgi:uncharacterized membrane protein YhaH (DUF805 family)